MNLWRSALSVLSVVSIIMLTPTGVASEDLDGSWRAPAVGTKLTYEDGTSREVVSVDGKKVYYKGERSPRLRDVEWYSYMGMFTSIASDGRKWKFDGKAIAQLFPLKIGNKSTVNVRIGNWRGRTTFKVTAVDEVETPIGMRKVFEIKSSTVGIHGGYMAKDWG